MKSNATMECVVSGSVLTWQFKSAPALSFDMAKVSDDVRQYAMVDRFRAKIGDAAAKPRDKATGKSATEAEKRAAMQRVVDQLYAGLWNSGTREAGDETILFEALCRARPKQKPEQIAKWLAGLDADKRTELATSSATILPHILAIKSERRVAAVKAKGLDGDKILDSMPA